MLACNSRRHWSQMNDCATISSRTPELETSNFAWARGNVFWHPDVKAENSLGICIIASDHEQSIPASYFNFDKTIFAPLRDPLSGRNIHFEQCVFRIDVLTWLKHKLSAYSWPMWIVQGHFALLHFSSTTVVFVNRPTSIHQGAMKLKWFNSLTAAFNWYNITINVF